MALVRKLSWLSCGLLLASCALLPGAEPADALSPGEGAPGTETPIAGPTLPPSWTPDATPIVQATPLLRATATPNATPTPFASPTFSPGWTTYTVAQHSYALRLPPTWLPVRFDGQDAPSAVFQIEQGDPILGLSLRHGLPGNMLESTSFMAFDTSAVSEDAVFVSTLRAAQAASDDVQQAAEESRALLAPDPSVTVGADWPLRVGFEARSGWLLRYDTTFPPETPLVTTHHTQVFVENGRGQVIVFSFATEGALREGYERLFELVMDTVHFSL